MILFPDGFGGTAGDDPLVTADSIYVAADGGNDVYHVNSSTGSDTTGAGTRNSPYATVGMALSVAGNFDVIIVHSGHSETITVATTITARVIIIGEGAGDDRPLLTPNIAANGAMWTLSVSPYIRNLRFGASAQANTSPTIVSTALGAEYTEISHCKFYCGQYDAGNKATFSNTGRLFACEFVSTATSNSGRPSRAVALPMWTWGCTFDGGTYGWQNTTQLVHGWDNEASGPVGVTISGICQIEVTDGAYVAGTYRHFPDGLGMVGHPLIANVGLYVAGSIYLRYVDSQTGTDGAGYGASRDKPYATLKYAINTGALNAIFIVAAGHTETITSSAITADQATAWIIGEGEGDNRPLFTRGFSGIAVDLNALATTPHLMANVRFAISTASTSSTRVSASEVLAVVHNCDFQCGALDQGATIDMAHGVVVWACTFTSAVTSSATLPSHVLSGTHSLNFKILDCIFDGGAYGWTNGLAVDFQGFEMFAENLSLLRGSIFSVYETGGYATGFDCFIQVSEMTGESGVAFT